MYSTYLMANVVDSPELIGLLVQLRGAGSKLHRLKLAALAWRTLRGLSRDDQVAVATELGMEGAEKLIEQLGHAGGLSPAAVLAAVKRAEDADPNQLRQLLASITDGETRREVVDKARGAVERWLEEAVPRESEDEGDAEETSEVEAAVTMAPTSPPPAPPLTPTPPSPRTAPPKPPPEEIEAEPAQGPSEPQVSETPLASLVVQRAKPAPSKNRPPSVTGSSQPLPAAPYGRRLALRLAGLRSPIARLRVLSAAEAYTQRMDIGELREVIESFPPGWGRRRALVTLLNAGIPQALPVALELVQAVADRQAWLWALTALAARDLDRTDVWLLIASAERFPYLERRLRLRLGVGPKSRRPASVD